MNELEKIQANDYKQMAEGAFTAYWQGMALISAYDAVPDVDWEDVARKMLRGVAKAGYRGPVSLEHINYMIKEDKSIWCLNNYSYFTGNGGKV